MTYLAIGMAAGVLSGLFGIGGGVLIVPALILLTGMTPARATGTSLASLLLPVGALGAWEFWRKSDVHVGAALLIALGLFVGAWLGAKLGTQLPARELQRAFSLFLVAVAAHLWWAA